MYMCLCSVRFDRRSVCLNEWCKQKSFLCIWMAQKRFLTSPIILWPPLVQCDCSGMVVGVAVWFAGEGVRLVDSRRSPSRCGISVSMCVLLFTLFWMCDADHILRIRAGLHRRYQTQNERTQHIWQSFPSEIVCFSVVPCPLATVRCTVLLSTSLRFIAMWFPDVPRFDFILIGPLSTKCDRW